MRSNKINNAIALAILTVTLGIFKAVMKHDDAEGVDYAEYLIEHKEEMTEIKRQREEKIKEDLVRSKKNDWLIGTWVRDYDPSLKIPEQLVFKKNDLVYYNYYEKEQKEVRYYLNNKHINILGGLTISGSSGDIQLTTKKGITYQRY